MSVDEIIEELKGLDLCTYPEKRIRELLELLSAHKIGSISVDYHVGKSIIRARPNQVDEVFRKKKDFSFKPQIYNSTYQRASTPKNTMFYGTVIPEIIVEGELNNARLVGILETFQNLRNSNKEGKAYQKMSFGKWRVHSQLKLIGILHEENYYSRSSFIRKLVDNFNKYMAAQDKNVREDTTNFLNFMSSEFSKEHILSDSDYMISAIFTEFVTKMGFDGVLFPSVRAAGEGFNVALTPESIDKLGLYAAGECSIYKVDAEVIVGNDASVELDGITEVFDIEELEDNKRSEILEILGVSSIEELIE